MTLEDKINKLEEARKEDSEMNEIIQAETLLSQQEILINQKEQDETLAAILLIQAGGIANV